MRSRLAIAAVLATGLIMTGGSAGLALSGISGSGSAGSAQYLAPKQEQQLPPTSGGLPEGGGGGELPNAEELGQVQGADPGNDVQAARQSSGGGGSRQNLPFTGLAAIPLLLVGIVMTGTGLVMRRRQSGS